MRYVGLDVHQNRSSVCILDAHGKRVKEFEVGVDRAAGPESGEAAGRNDRDNFFALDADIGLFRAGGQDGEAAGDHGIEHYEVLRFPAIRTSKILPMP